MFGPSHHQIHHRHQHDRRVAASALQEIEVVSMDDGDDEYVLERGVDHSSSACLPNLIATSPLSLADSSDSTTNSPRCVPSTSQDEANRSAERRLESLLAMASKERPARPPAGERNRRRHHVRPTPISNAARSALSSSTSGRRPRPDRGPPVNDHDRTKMVDWYYEMSDFLKIERGTASRSLTLLDRFMATRHDSPHVDGGRRVPYSRPDVPGVVAAARLDRDEYQLAALTALFLGIKLHERLNIQPGHVAYLSRGRYGPDEVIEMEGIMLAALGWRVSGADKVDFVEAYMGLLLPDSPEIVRDRSSDDVMMVDGDDPASSVADLSHLQVSFDESEYVARAELFAIDNLRSHHTLSISQRTDTALRLRLHLLVPAPVPRGPRRGDERARAQEGRAVRTTSARPLGGTARRHGRALPDPRGQEGGREHGGPAAAPRRAELATVFGAGGRRGSARRGPRGGRRVRHGGLPVLRFAHRGRPACRAERRGGLVVRFAQGGDRGGERAVADVGHREHALRGVVEVAIEGKGSRRRDGCPPAVGIFACVSISVYTILYY